MTAKASLHHKNESLRTIQLGKSSMSLIAKGDDCEVILQNVPANDLFGISPPETFGHLFEFIFVLSGSVTYLKSEDVQEFYETGSYFFFNDVVETYVFKAKEHTVLLYVSSKPVFDTLSEEHQNLLSMVSQVEEKDPYTKEHSSRVCRISVKIAEHLGLSHDAVKNVYYASMFHDVGKIDVDSQILTKPDKLTQEEFSAIKEHVQMSVNLTKPIEALGITEIIRQHHERLDGSGYPNGLKDDEIMIEARIIAVADTFDAMTSDRSYRKALSFEFSLNEIESLVGKHYDKDVVEALKTLIKNNAIV